MSDEVILQYVKSIDERTARMETTISTAMQIYQKEDKESHDIMDKRIHSLENSRLAARVILGTVTIGTPIGAVKLGLIDKLMGLF